VFKTLMQSNGRVLRGLVVAATAGALVLTGALSVGCAASTSEKPAATKTASVPAAAVDSKVQTCLECGSKKMPAMVVGKASLKEGVQVVMIDIKGGTYVPNTISVKAGMPVKVVFSGLAKGCLAKPMFKALDKKLDLTTTGMGTIDLGVVKAGTYKFTCGMGMNAGTITAS